MLYSFIVFVVVFFFKQKTAYEMRISDWSSDVCSSDLPAQVLQMRVPRDGHEDVRQHQQACGLCKHREVDWHGGPWKMRIVTVCRARSEEHTSELQSLMRISYAVLCLKKKTQQDSNTYTTHTQSHY